MNDDGELVDRARTGDGAAYGELARRWSVRVLAICRSRLRSVHAAEDAAQETLLRGLRSLETLRDREAFGAWIRGIAHRVCIDWCRSKQNGQVPFSTLASNGDGEPVPIASPEEDRLEREDDHRRLHEELEALDDDTRETLMLYYTREFTYRELADLQGIAVGTVNARLARAREQLRRRLSRAEVER